MSILILINSTKVLINSLVIDQDHTFRIQTMKLLLIDGLNILVNLCQFWEREKEEEGSTLQNQKGPEHV